MMKQLSNLKVTKKITIKSSIIFNRIIYLIKIEVKMHLQHKEKKKLHIVSVLFNVYIPIWQLTAHDPIYKYNYNVTK